MPTVYEIENKIASWLESESWTVVKSKSPDYDFMYTVTLPSDSKVTIGFEQKLDRIVILNLIGIPEDLQKSYKLSPIKYDFFYELKINLTLMDVLMEVQPNIEGFNMINLAKFIYMDGFSRDKLINCIWKISNATELCNISWTRFTDESSLTE
ncbi:MAG: DUF2299 family protein [Thermoproteota archaeon]|nr:DUF2299 family protein [Thermoproteota archaeon]